MAAETLVSEELSLVVMGDCKVGKSALVERYAQSYFRRDYLPTIGADYESRVAEVDGRVVRMHLWDTSGQRAFLWEAAKQIREADGFLFVYDVTDALSFRHVREWLELARRGMKHPTLPSMLLGTKSDQRPLVSASQAKEFGIPEGMTHMEVSAWSGRNVSAAFYVLARDVLLWRRLGCVSVVGSAAFPIEAPESVVPEASDGPEYTHLFKLLLVGAPRVGKTCLRFRFTRDHYSSAYSATPGFDYSTRTVRVDGDKVRVQVWDVSGDAAYHHTRKAYYRGADAFLIVYDVTSEDSFREAGRLLKEINMCGNADPPKLLVGTKTDRQERRVVDAFTAREFAEGWHVPLVETSARHGDNVQGAFMKVISALKRKMAPWKKVYEFS